MIWDWRVDLFATVLLTIAIAAGVTLSQALSPFNRSVCLIVDQQIVVCGHDVTKETVEDLLR